MITVRALLEYSEKLTMLHNHYILEQGHSHQLDIAVRTHQGIDLLLTHLVELRVCDLVKFDSLLIHYYTYGCQANVLFDINYYFFFFNE